MYVTVTKDTEIEDTELASVVVSFGGPTGTVDFGSEVLVAWIGGFWGVTVRIPVKPEDEPGAGGRV